MIFDTTKEAVNRQKQKSNLLVTSHVEAVYWTQIEALKASSVSRLALSGGRTFQSRTVNPSVVLDRHCREIVVVFLLVC
jgi:hypothetical protein